MILSFIGVLVFIYHLLLDGLLSKKLKKNHKLDFVFHNSFDVILTFQHGRSSTRLAGMACSGHSKSFFGDLFLDNMFAVYFHLTVSSF